MSKFTRQHNNYSETCVREPPSRLTLNSGWCGKSCLSYKGTCHVILLAKLHDMYLYKTTTFPHQPLKSISKVAVWHRFYCTFFFVSKKIGFDISCKLSLDETICMKCQSCFLGKIRKIFQNAICWNFFPVSIKAYPTIWKVNLTTWFYVQKVLTEWKTV